MSTLRKLIASWMPSIQPQHVRDEAFLADSVDVYDLERRMREIDRRGREPARWHLDTTGLR